MRIMYDYNKGEIWIMRVMYVNVSNEVWSIRKIIAVGQVGFSLRIEIMYPALNSTYILIMSCI